MADVDGKIVLGLDISRTTQQMNQDLNRVLANIGKKQIILSAKIDNINFGNSAAQIRSVTNQINREFNSTLNVIDLVNGGIGNLSKMLQGAGFSKGSISTITQDLQKMSLQIDRISTTMSQNGNIKLRIQGTDDLQRAVTIVRQYNSETGRVTNSSKSFVQSFKESSNAADDFEKRLNKVNEAISSNKIEAAISNVTAQYNRLGSTGHEKLYQIQDDIQNLNLLHRSMMEETNPEILVDSYDQYGQVLSRVKNNLSIVSVETKGFTEHLRENQSALTKIKAETLSNRIQAWMNNNQKAAKLFSNELLSMQRVLSNCSDNTELANVRAEFTKIQSEAKLAGLTTNQFAQSIKNAGLQLLGLTNGYMVLSKLISIIANGCKAVIDLDTALIDLKKTTTMSGPDLVQFYKDANKAAKDLGVTTKDIIQSAADWSRLGFSDKNSSETMAKLAAQFSMISPGVDIDTSTTGLVSVIKAYGIETERVLDDVMSKINIVGNTAATSNKEIISGLQNSASAMAAMNTTLDENIALFTAAQEITQDDSKVGNALRSISMRIRGYDEETGELSEELANITGEVYDLTKATENSQGVSLFTDETQEHYKSIYQYLKEIAGIYNDLSEKQQQQLMEKLFGKNRASIGQAILQNFEAAEKAMDNMAKSAGNADKEMEDVKSSLEYKLNALKETTVGIFQDMFPREDIGIVIDSLQVFLEIIGTITSELGPFKTALLGVGSALMFKNLG